MRESESSQHFHQWRLDAFSIPHYVMAERCDLVVLGTAKLRHSNKAFLGPQCADEMYQKEFWWNSTIVSNEIQYIVIHNSKLAGPRRRASQWINWHRKTIPTAHPLRSTRDLRKNWCISLNKSGRNAPMKLRSDFREAVTIMNRLHRESGEERPEPILFHQYQRWHSSSSSNSSWWQWDKNWWSS